MPSPPEDVDGLASDFVSDFDELSELVSAFVSDVFGSADLVSVFVDEAEELLRLSVL